MLLPIVSVGQISTNYLKMLNNTDSNLYSTNQAPVIVTDTFSVIEIQKIVKPVACKCRINGKPKKILKGAIIPEYRNQTSFFRHNQIYFIRLRKDYTVYGVISITKKSRKEKNSIEINNMYLFTIKPYNKENFVPNEKLYFKYEFEGVTFRVSSQDLFIENIYTTDNLEGLEYYKVPKN